MATVTFPTELGGDGSTVTDDGDPTTGLADGGHRQRFVPALAQVVAMAQTSVDNATESATQAEKLSATSTTSRTIGTGSVTFTTQSGKAFSAGAFVSIIADAGNTMHGQVVSYSGTSLEVDVTRTTGSGTFASWTITVAGAIGPQGAQGPQGDQGIQGAQGPQGDQGIQGAQGDLGWSPILAVVSDGSRRVLQVADWTGGEGAKPATGSYIGASGLVADLANAVDIRGSIGPQGDQGIQGPPGDFANNFAGAWAPGETQAGEIKTHSGSSWLALAVTSDEPSDTSPDWAIVARKGVDGSGAVNTVNSRSPDLNGNVAIVTSDVPEVGNLYFTDARVSANADVTASKDVTDLLTVSAPTDLDSIRTRVDDLDAAVVLRGSWDASLGAFPGGGTAQAGDSYIVSVGGAVDGVEFTDGDRIVAIVDNASETVFAGNWLKLDYTDRVSSVHGRTGAVVASTGDYTAEQITETATAKIMTDAERTKLSNQREVLTADRTYYVDPAGSNSNDGLSAGSPFATIQHAVDITSKLDVNGFQLTIQLADGTYNETVGLKTIVGVLGETKPPQIIGNTTTPSNVVITTGGNVITFLRVDTTWAIGGFELNSTGGRGIFAVRPSAGNLRIIAPVVFNTTSGMQDIIAFHGPTISIEADYEIKSGGGQHVFVTASNINYFNGPTITLTNTPNYLDTFAKVSVTGVLSIAGATFSGSATGKRYIVLSNGVIDTAGGGASFLPGDVAGTEASGGQYV